MRRLSAATEIAGGILRFIDKLLVVDDDDRFRERLAVALAERGVAVTAAAGAAEGLAAAQSVHFDGVVTDLKMPGDGGLKLLKSLRELSPKSRVVVLTGYGSVATAVEAMRLGATNYIIKPCNADQVLAAFDESFEPFDESKLALQTPSLARLEREHIERVLVDCGGNVSKAARVLGIHRRTLQYKLLKFPVSR